VGRFRFGPVLHCLWQGEFLENLWHFRLVPFCIVCGKEIVSKIMVYADFYGLTQGSRGFGEKRAVSCRAFRGPY